MTLLPARLTPIALTLLILILGTCGMAFLLALLPAAGHDQLWFLLMASRWLHGATLYGPEAFDSNPPAIVWISAVPVFLADHLHLPLPFTAKLLCLLLILAIALLLHSVVPPLARASSGSLQRTTASLALLLAFLLFTCVIPARDFGQRDHLTALLVLPYLLTAFVPPRILSPFRCVALPLLAALGVCLKPQQALVPLVVELVLLFRTRRLARPAPWVFLAIGALYLTAIRHFAPLYFSVALPTTLSTYWAIGHLTFLQLLREAPQLHLLALFTLVLALRSRAGPLSSTILALLLAGVAATAAYYLQGTGWYYQQLPALTFFGLAFAFQLLSLGYCRFDRFIVDPALTPPRYLSSSALPTATALLSLLALTLTFHFSGFPLSRRAFTDAYTNTTPDPTFFEHLPPGTPVATLTTSVDDAIMPVFRYHLTWAQRTNNLWTLPALLRADQRLTLGQQIPPGSAEFLVGPGATPLGAMDGSSTPTPTPPSHGLTPGRLAALEAQQRRWMVEDLLRWRPALILVARCQSPEVHCQTLEDRHDDLLAFFLQDPAFTRIWSHYHLLRASGLYDAYTLTAPW